jgi:hypothetical protein
MHWVVQLSLGLALLAAAIALMLLEYVRNRSGRPLLTRETVAIPYHVLYLSLAVLGVALALRGIIH